MSDYYTDTTLYVNSLGTLLKTQADLSNAIANYFVNTLGGIIYQTANIASDSSFTNSADVLVDNVYIKIYGTSSSKMVVRVSAGFEASPYASNSFTTPLVNNVMTCTLRRLHCLSGDVILSKYASTIVPALYRVKGIPVIGGDPVLLYSTGACLRTSNNHVAPNGAVATLSINTGTAPLSVYGGSIQALWPTSFTKYDALPLCTYILPDAYVGTAHIAKGIIEINGHVYYFEDYVTTTSTMLVIELTNG